MSEEENKAAARRVAEESLDERNIYALDELLNPKVFNHEAIRELQRGADGFNETVRWVLAAFADLHYDIEKARAPDEGK